jgi:hypothetical protein
MAEDENAAKAASTGTTVGSLPSSGYANGSDMLLSINGDCIGHCTEHTVTYDTESKTRSVKAPAKQGIDASSLFDETAITKLSITISFKGLRTYSEGELPFQLLLEHWRNAEPISVDCFPRSTTGAQCQPYLCANAVITKLTENNPAGDDASYDGELKVTGVPTTWEPSNAV